MDKPLLVAARGGKPAHTPLWLMRQAGRYLPEYRALREKSDTLTMFRTPVIATEITLQPLRRFPLDAAIVYADILLLPDALGLGLSFVAGEGPKFARVVRDEESLAWLRKQASDPAKIRERLSYVGETLSRVKEGLSPTTALIGFAGAPWTVASYMMEGGSAGGEFVESKKVMFERPEVLKGLLAVLTDLTIDYLHMQVDAGAEILQLFESWGGALTPAQYAEFALPCSRRILEALSPRVPFIHFVGEGAGLTHLSLSAGGHIYGVDWRQDLSRVSALAREHGMGVQGNLDPMLLFAPQNLMCEAATEIVRAGRAHAPGFIFNLGHGIRQHTPVENVAALVKHVHGLRF